MPTSQFTIYSSGDPGAPILNGLTGSLINVLTACLVTGYPGHSGSGWIKTLPEIGSGSIATASLMGYTNVSGSGMTLFVNDCGPNTAAASQGREARLTGWELLTSLTSSTDLRQYTGSWGGGGGQFPMAYQNTIDTFTPANGIVGFRKSSATTAFGVPWILAADAYTMYFWAATGDTAGIYHHFAFGDIYSFYGQSDRYRCMIIGRKVEGVASTTTGTTDWTDRINAYSFLNTNQPSHYMARTPAGIGSSMGFLKKGDGGVGVSVSSTSPNSHPISGVITCPNGGDNSFYLHPIQVVWQSGIRGRMRGLYQVCHDVTNFSDGQMIQGSGDYAGKTFMIIKQGVGFGFWALEISATVETN